MGEREGVGAEEGGVAREGKGHNAGAKVFFAAQTGGAGDRPYDLRGDLHFNQRSVQTGLPRRVTRLVAEGTSTTLSETCLYTYTLSSRFYWGKLYAMQYSFRSSSLLYSTSLPPRVSQFS